MSISDTHRRRFSHRALTCAAYVFLFTAAPFGCRRNTTDDSVPMFLAVKSESFQQGEDIPDRFTCKGANTSPEISWSGQPPETKSLALIVTDPDSLFGSYVHWILYNLPPQPGSIAEGVPRRELLPDGAKQGLAGDDAVGYSGPCPPGSSPHRYVFTLYALNATLTPADPVDKKHLMEAMAGHILSAGQLMGHYHR